MGHLHGVLHDQRSALRPLYSCTQGSWALQDVCEYMSSFAAPTTPLSLQQGASLPN